MDKVILGTQIVTLLSFVGVAFWLYKILVEAKDATIALLKERVADRDAKIAELESRTPDELVKALSARVDLTLKEIERLRQDDDANKQLIASKEADLHSISGRLQDLSNLIKDSDLVCPSCGAPLMTRATHTIYGHVGGREVDADVEYREYECGYAVDDDKGTVSHCPNAKRPT